MEVVFMQLLCGNQTLPLCPNVTLDPYRVYLYPMVPFGQADVKVDV